MAAIDMPNVGELQSSVRKAQQHFENQQYDESMRVVQEVLTTTHDCLEKKLPIFKSMRAQLQAQLQASGINLELPVGLEDDLRKVQEEAEHVKGKLRLKFEAVLRDWDTHKQDNANPLKACCEMVGITGASLSSDPLEQLFALRQKCPLKDQVVVLHDTPVCPSIDHVACTVGCSAL